MDLQTVGTFFNTAWSVYDTALERNYMYHREIYAGVLDQLQTCQAGQYTLLDLGCGSAETFAPVLAQHPPLRYVPSGGWDGSSSPKTRRTAPRTALPSRPTGLFSDRH